MFGSYTERPGEVRRLPGDRSHDENNALPLFPQERSNTRSSKLDCMSYVDINRLIAISSRIFPEVEPLLGES